MIHSEVMTVTPEMAKRVLDRCQVQNRNLSRQRVESIALDIQNGHWFLTHQGIAFDDDGNLLDGQHRLAAIIKANIPIKMMVTKGMTKEACIPVDDVRPRSVTDHVKQLGGDVSTSHWAIANILEYGPDKPISVSMCAKLDLIEKYSPAIGFSVKICRSARKFQAASKAVIARAYYTQDHEKLKRFMDVYINGQPESKSESAPIILSRYLIDVNASSYGWAGRREQYEKTESALWAFLHGKPIQKLYGFSKELFPIPENKLII